MPFINRYTITTRGAITITGNSSGLTKATNLLQPGIEESLGAFITVNTALPTPVGWGGIVNLANGENVTLNYLENSSAANLSILPGSTVLYAELIWGAISYSVSGNIDIRNLVNNAVNFTTPLGTFSVAPDTITSVDITGFDNTGFYSRSANVTNYVAAAGGGRYVTGAIPAILDRLDNNVNAVGWSLIVVYRNVALPTRNMTVFAKGDFVESNSPPLDTSITGFVTPAIGTVGGRISVSALEGDAPFTGDIMSFGPNFSNLTNLYGPNNPANPPNSINNFFASQINNGDPNSPNVGALDTTGTFGNRNANAFTGANTIAGRQGWDVTNVSINSLLGNSATTAAIRFSTTSDRFLPNGIGVQIDNVDILTKTVDKTTADVGDILTYTVSITNGRSITENNILVQDSTPAGTTYAGGLTVSAPFTGTDLQTGITITSLAPGQTVTISWKVIINDVQSVPNQISNTAAITVPGDPPEVTNTVTTTINKADIAVTKTVNTNPIIAGQQVVYTMVARNNGPNIANNVTFNDTISPCLLNPEYSVNNGSTWNSWLGSLNIGSLNNGSTITVLLRGTVSPACTGTIDNIVIVDSTTHDPDQSNNTATVRSNITTLADILVSKSVSPSPLLSAQQGIYTITVSNLGPSDAQSVLVTDTIPTCILNPEYSINGGTNWSLWTGSLNIGTVAFNNLKTVLIRGIVDPSCIGTISNTVTVSSPTPDPNLNNNTASITTSISTSADISVNKTVSPLSPIAGTEVIYTLVVSNGGPSDAQSVSLADNLPLSISSGEYSIDGGITWLLWGGSVNLGTLSVSGTKTVLIRGNINSQTTGNIINTATVSSPTPDPNLNNNTSTITTAISTLADVRVIKTIITNPIVAGEPINYSIIVENLGPSTALSISLSDIVSSEILNAEFSINNGITYSPWISPYALGNLNVGESRTILIRGLLTP